MFLIAISAGFLNWSKFRIQKISVKTDSSVLNAEKLSARISNYMDRKYFGIFPADNIFLFSKEKAEKAILDDFLRVKEIYMNKDFPNTISLEVKERKPEALLCYGDECGFLDETGFVFEKAAVFSGAIFAKFKDSRTNTAKISIGEQFLNPDEFRNIVYFKNFAADEGIIISEIEIKNEEIYKFFVSGGWFILLNENNNSKKAFENLKTSLKEKIGKKRENLEYIDLRFGNKVFYKFKQ